MKDLVLLPSSSKTSSPTFPSTFTNPSSYLPSYLSNSTANFLSYPGPSSSTAFPTVTPSLTAPPSSLALHNFADDSEGVPYLNLAELERYAGTPDGISSMRMLQEFGDRTGPFDSDLPNSPVRDMFPLLLLPNTLNTITPPPDRADGTQHEELALDQSLYRFSADDEPEYACDVKSEGSPDEAGLRDELDGHLPIDELATAASLDAEHSEYHVLNPLYPADSHEPENMDTAVDDPRAVVDEELASDHEESEVKDEEEDVEEVQEVQEVEVGPETPLEMPPSPEPILVEEPIYAPEEGDELEEGRLFTRRQRRFRFLPVEVKDSRRTRAERITAHSVGRGRSTAIHHSFSFAGAEYLDVTSGSANERIAKACGSIFQRRLRCFGQRYCANDSPAYLPGLPSHHMAVDLKTVNVSNFTAHELLAAAKSPYLERWLHHLEQCMNPSELVVCAPNGFPLSRVQQIVMNEELNREVLEPMRGHHVCRVCNESQLSAVHLAAHYDQHDPKDLGHIIFCPHPNCVWSLIGFAQVSSLHRHLREMHKGNYAFCRTCAACVPARTSAMKAHFEHCNGSEEASYDVFMNTRQRSLLQASTA